MGRVNRRVAREARDRFIRANLRLVIGVATQYVGSRIPLMDLIAEGNLGLIRAVHGFDPSRNCRFSTYAIWWVRQAIQRAIIKTRREAPGRGIAEREAKVLPAAEQGNVEGLLGRLRAREEEVVRLRFGLGPTPAMTLQAIASQLGVTRERVRQIEQAALGRLRRLLA